MAGPQDAIVVTMDIGAPGHLLTVAGSLNDDLREVDVTEFVTSMRTGRGRDRETDNYQPGTMTLTLNDTDRRFDPLNGPRIGWIEFQGLTSTFDSTPDHASLDITGDLSFYFQLHNLQTDSTIRTVVAKWATSNASYAVSIMTDNKVRFIWTENGTTPKTLTTTGALPTGHDRLTVVVNHDVDNGLGGSTLTVVYATSDDGSGAQQAGDPVTLAGVTSHFSGTAALRIGLLGTGTEPMDDCGIIDVEVHNGLWPQSTIAAQRTYVLVEDQVSPYTSPQGDKTWTITGTAFTFEADTGSPYHGGLVPMRPVRVTLNSANVQNFVDWADGHVASPDSAQLSVTGDIDVRWFGTLTDWDNATSQAVFNKFLTTGDQRSWMIRCESAGVRFYISTDGTAANQFVSTAVPVPFTNSVYGGIRFTRVQSTGLTTVYFSDDDGETWDASATTTVLSAGSAIFNSTADVVIGGFNDGITSPPTGRFLRAELWNGIEGSGGTLVASPDFTVLLAGRHLFFEPLTDAEGNVWNGFGSNIRVQAGSNMFTGFVQDWETDYEQADNIGRVTVTCTDAMASLAVMELATLASQHSGDKSGERVDRVLAFADTVNYGNPSSVATGLSTFGATTYGGNALQYLQRCAQGEGGYLFVDVNGVLQFLDRHTTLNSDTTAAVFVDAHSGAGILCRRMPQTSTADLLFNRVTGAGTSGTERTANDADSQADFQHRTLAVGDLLNLSDPEVDDLLQWLLQRFKAPEPRFSEIEINTFALAAADAQLVALLELATVVTVKRRPLGIGDIIDTTAIVDGITHDITPGHWTTRIRLANADTRPFFILDDAVFGALDSNRLAF